MNLKSASIYMSRILRHEPELIDIKIEYHGAWANTNELINGISRKFKGFNMEILEKIVAQDQKQRYAFNEDKTKIRANQGHSINVDMGYEPKTPPEILYHGTGRKSVEYIDKEGLTPQNRLYVHLSLDKETAIKVGSRHGSPFVYVVLAGIMHRDGYEFYQADNGVWLTKSVPLKYLKKIGK